MNIDTRNIYQFLAIIVQNWTILPQNITFLTNLACQLVISYRPIWYYDPPTCKIFNHYILAYKIKQLFSNFSRLLNRFSQFNQKRHITLWEWPDSRLDFCTAFAYFTPKMFEWPTRVGAFPDFSNVDTLYRDTKHGILFDRVGNGKRLRKYWYYK